MGRVIITEHTMVLTNSCDQSSRLGTERGGGGGRSTTEGISVLRNVIVHVIE